MRGAAELDHDLRAACGEALAGAKIERNASPAPVVDQQFGGNESFGLGRRTHVELFAVAGHELTVELSRRILPANDLLSDHPQIERADGLEHFQFFVAHGGGIKRSRRLNGYQRGQLKNVALNHVAESARRFIKTAAALDTERFRRGDLHVIDIIAVPERLENPVAEAQNEKVLHGVLTKVMVDAVDLLFVENIEDNLIQGFG